MKRRTMIGRGAALFVLLAPSARADNVEAGRARYVEGAADFARGDYPSACRAFADADALAPRDEALEAALRSCVLAGDAPRAMTLADRADTRPFAPAGLAEAQREARAKLSSRAGRVRLACDACRGAIDGDAVLPRSETWVGAGSHIVTFSGSPDRWIDVAGEATVDVAPPRPTRASTPPRALPRVATPAAHETGLSQVWFWTGVGLSAALGGVTTASFADAASRHNGFVGAGCQNAAIAGCAQMAGAGRDAEARSYVLLGVSGAAVLATVAVGWFAVRWHDAGVTVGPTHAGWFVRY